MKQKLISVLAVLAFVALASPVIAKRSAPKPVASVTQDGIEYSAPLEREGFVVATWVKTKREIWSRQVYVIKHEYQRGLETDVQTCFITRLEGRAGKLRVWNERGAEFEVDLQSLAVAVVKGPAVIDYTGREPPGQ